MTRPVLVLAAGSRRWLPPLGPGPAGTGGLPADPGPGDDVVVWLPPATTLLAQRWYDETAGSRTLPEWLGEVTGPGNHVFHAEPVRTVEQLVDTLGAARVRVLSGSAAAVAATLDPAAGTATTCAAGIDLVAALAGGIEELRPRYASTTATLVQAAAAEALVGLDGTGTPVAEAAELAQRWWHAARERIAAAGAGIEEVPETTTQSRTTGELAAMMGVRLLARATEPPAAAGPGEADPPVEGQPVRALIAELAVRVRRRMTRGPR